MLSYSEQMQHPLWLAKKDEIFRRDNEKCRICGDGSHRLQVHHLCYFPDLLAWEYDNELLITVCLKHHELLTFELPKLSGLIAFRILTSDFDPLSIDKLFELLKKINNATYKDDKTRVLESSSHSKAG